MASVTIIIPVRNRAALLPRLFRSLSALTYEELEVVLVDNASTDNTLSLCRAYASEAPLVVRVLEEPEVGAGHARNCGLDDCHTEWVYFFDSDDELSPTFLEEVMPQLDGYDMAAFPTMQEVNGGPLRQRQFRPSASVASQILSSTLNTPSMLFRTSFLRKIGGWDGDLPIWQDWELGIHALLHKPRIRWFRSAFHCIHIHPDSITGASMASRRNAMQRTMESVAAALTAACDRRALTLRNYIVNGLLQREGASPLPHVAQPSFAVYLLGRFLQAYTACGGRGAWRVALLFCR